MPARHDMLCGALDFLWRPVGLGRMWERTITSYLREAGVTTMLISDHPHLFEVGGENYHTEFTAWDYKRGHEGDPWKTRPDTSWVGAPPMGRAKMPYDNSRGYFRGEEDFPGPRTMAAAAQWLDDNAGYHDRFMLFVDEFDPHEPFDTPDEYALMYDDTWEGPHLIWPPYVNGAIAAGVLDERQARQVRACYGGKLTMIDAWFGRILDAIERQRHVGRHRRHRLHRPRSLPGREGHLGQAERPDLRDARSHPADGRRGRASNRARRPRSRRTSTSSRRWSTCSAPR